MEAIIELADSRGVVLGLLDVVRRLVCQLSSLLDEWGIAAPTKAPSNARKMANTRVMAAHRGSLWLTNQEAAGSRPSARKNACR